MSIAPVVVLDLDGTLLCSAFRHYTVYCLIIRRLGLEALPYTIYWQGRRKGLSNLEMLFYTGLQAADRQWVQALWHQHIESVEMLRLDELFPGVIEWLQTKQVEVRFVLVTLRSKAYALKAQLAWLGLTGHFQHILIVPHQPQAAQSKARIVESNIQTEILAWVGDSEVDMQAAQQLGVQAIGVTSGMRSAGALLAAGADKIFANIIHLQKW